MPNRSVVKLTLSAAKLLNGVTVAAICVRSRTTCQGDRGNGDLRDRLVGGQGTIGTPKPIRTVGSYWPYAATL